MNNSTNHPRTQKFLVFLFCMAIIAALVVLLVDFPTLKDKFKNIGYEAPEEVALLEDELDLTDRAKTIYRASRPELEDRDTFNESCKSYNSEISVLGCYGAEKIHIYNIQDDSLAGIKESTAAHELLHAVWERLSLSEKDELIGSLNEAYQNNYDALSKDLEIYNESEKMDELHSRLGTQYKDLPQKLEDHYANYFKDQDKIVDYYDQYKKPFNDLKDEIEILNMEMKSLKEDLDKITGEYYSEAETLSGDIDRFNQCADQTGCFADYDAFAQKRSELVSRQQALEDKFADIELKTKVYNEKVKKHNDNILQTEALENIVNSNALPKEEIDSN